MISLQKQTTFFIVILIVSFFTCSGLTRPDSLASAVFCINAGMSKVFAIETPDAMVLIDAGSPGKEQTILRQLKKVGTKPLRLIVITHAHFDHYGSAARLRELTGAKIAIHENDAADMAQGATPIRYTRGWGRIGYGLLPLAETLHKPTPTTADITLRDGDQLLAYGLDARIVHTPGHTKGSISVFLRDSTAIAGDLLVSQPWPARQCYFADSWTQIDSSVARLKSCSPRRVFSGHSNKAVDKIRFDKL